MQLVVNMCYIVNHRNDSIPVIIESSDILYDVFDLDLLPCELFFSFCIYDYEYCL